MRGTFGQIWCRSVSDEWPDDPEAVARAGSVSWKDSAIEAGTLARSVSDSIAKLHYADSGTMKTFSSCKRLPSEPCRLRSTAYYPVFPPQSLLIGSITIIAPSRYYFVG